MIRTLDLKRDISPWLNALLDATSLSYEEAWEGSFKGRAYGGAPIDFRLRMWLHIGTEVIEGDGKGIDFPRQDEEP